MQNPEQLTKVQISDLVNNYNEMIYEGYIPEILCTISTLQTLFTEHIHHTGQSKSTPMHIHSIERIRMLFEVYIYQKE